MTTATKVRTRAEAVAWRRAQRGPVVFTNGVFDLLHRGHVDCLEAARGLGDALVVGVNSDRSAELLAKGRGRPVVPGPDRARLLAALAVVDCVVIFDEPTPLELVSALRPDVITKGSDYTHDTIVGADVVEAWGGRVEVLPLTPNQSTTRIMERIRATR